MKRFIKAFILIIIIISLIFTNVSLAGLADWTREEADMQAEQDLQEQNEKQREREGKSDNTYLSSLSIENHEISPVFQKDISNYKIEEEISDNKIKINAIPEDSRSIVEGAGEISLSTGVNNLEIKVTAENGFTRIYYIIVDKIEKENSSKLKNIIVSGVDKENKYKIELSPKFESSIYFYTCEIKEKIEKIEIDYESDNDDSQVKVIGNFNLPDVENTFTIIVGDEGQETIYKILIYNKALSEKLTSVNNTSEEVKENNGYVILIIIALLIVSVLFGLIIIRRLNRKTKH